MFINNNWIIYLFFFKSRTTPLRWAITVNKVELMWMTVITQLQLEILVIMNNGIFPKQINVQWEFVQQYFQIVWWQWNILKKFMQKDAIYVGFATFLFPPPIFDYISEIGIRIKIGNLYKFYIFYDHSWFLTKKIKPLLTDWSWMSCMPFVTISMFASKAHVSSCRRNT